MYAGGILRSARIRHILTDAGYRLSLGWPTRPDDLVGVWGHSRHAARGEWVAARSGAALVRLEDAFLRSLHPGRGGAPPLGLVVDHSGIYFDASRPSDLETLLKTHPFDDAALLTRAHDGIARMRAAHLSKYSACDPDLAPPAPGYVLVIDQTRGDASIRLGNATRHHFAEALFTAREDHPDARIVIKTHPETVAGHRAGHFDAGALDGRTTLLDAPVSPWALLDGAIAVYCVTSQMGFEAILAGHRPRVFGQPFYAGWGLSDDLTPPPRRGRALTRAQLFAGAMLLYPRWHDQYRARPTPETPPRFEDALAAMEAEARAWRQDRHGHVAAGMRLWKRAPLQRFFGAHRRLRFAEGSAALRRAVRERRDLLVWAGKADAALTDAAEAEGVRLYRVEDGFLRSRGLGADLIPPLSLVLDPDGIYYDPSGASALETLIAARATLTDQQRRRARGLIEAVLAARLSKYNLIAGAPQLAPVAQGVRRILVPGQVEEDASIVAGSPRIRDNLSLLRHVRQANPDAQILYKPHPDVEAGLRQGRIARAALEGLADAVLDHADPVALLEQVDEVWTMTSLLGFEALLRGRAATCLGLPFYAGWGLTRDICRPPARRRRHVPLEGLVHAALIEYPRYFDPVTGRPCPVEIAVARLAHGDIPHPGPFNRITAKAQGALASQAWLWR
ncbi:capsular polysaccharide biosynthesis protein [Brevirhabdus sp.]|uniref:capsular polysaccharide biosynthesis protein n=1 Tax=Brevirhabdus sp. TaxID=2004514 RepID=UPI00405A184C